MTVFGLDISHHQDLALDLARCKREGIDFVFIKATEGGSYTDPEFAANLAEARAAGMLVGAYCFVRASASPAAHAAHIRRVVPRDVPVIPDVEVAADKSWPSKPHADACLAAIRAAGYRVPLSYIPLWFWRDKWRSPSLAGWPLLWSSRYPDNVIGTLQDEWADVPDHYWNGYGGLPVAVLQFTSSARIAGHAPLDANAYRGTRSQLAALLGGQTVEDDMQLTDRVDWDRINALGPDYLGHKILGTWQHAVASRALNTQILAAVTKDAGVTPEQVEAALDRSVAEHMPTAQETAAALLPVVEDVARRVVAADNEALADEFLRQLREALPEGT